MFRANGSTVKFAGFMKVYIEGDDEGTQEEEKCFPKLKAGDQLKSGN